MATESRGTRNSPDACTAREPAPFWAGLAPVPAPVPRLNPSTIQAQSRRNSHNPPAAGVSHGGPRRRVVRRCVWAQCRDGVDRRGSGRSPPGQLARPGCHVRWQPGRHRPQENSHGKPPIPVWLGDRSRPPSRLPLDGLPRALPRSPALSRTLPRAPALSCALLRSRTLSQTLPRSPRASSHSPALPRALLRSLARSRPCMHRFANLCGGGSARAGL